MNQISRIVTVIFAAGLLSIAGASVGGTQRALGQDEPEVETVKATQSVKVMKTPGEQSEVVTRVASGEVMTVLAHQGRWIKVRVNGRTGWVTRSTVASTRTATDTPRNTRRRPFVDGRGTHRDLGGGAPDDRIGADAVDTGDGGAGGDTGEPRDDNDKGDPAKPGADATKPAAPTPGDTKKPAADPVKKPAAVPADKAKPAADDDDDDDDGDERIRMVTVIADAADLFEKPDGKGESVLTAEEGDTLRVIRESGSWLLVENDDEDAGWVRAKDVRFATDFGSDAPWERPTMMTRGGARLGYTAMSSSFASNGTGTLSTYDMTASAGSLIVGGQVDYATTPRIILSGDAQYAGTMATPGISYEGDTGQTSNVTIMQHEIDLGVAAGYAFGSQRNIVASARLGYYYSMAAVGDVEDLEKNLAHLPSEQLKGTTIGAVIDVEHLTEKLGFQVEFSALYPLATRVQTVGLEDGASSDVFAAWVGTRVGYRLTSSLAIDAGYRYAYGKTDWTGTAPESLRGHNASAASRRDIGHMISLGVATSF